MELETKQTVTDLVNDGMEVIKEDLLKPLDIKEINTKQTLTIGLLLSIFMMFLNFISTCLLSCRTYTHSYKGKKAVWDFSGMKNLNFSNLVFKNLVIYIVSILIIALIIYIVSMIIKNQINYFKILSMMYPAVIIYMIGCIFLSPILSIISSYLSFFMYAISITYAVAILSTLLNQELNISKYKKLYFYTLSYSLVLMVGYIAILKFKI